MVRFSLILPAVLLAALHCGPAATWAQGADDPKPADKPDDAGQEQRDLGERLVRRATGESDEDVMSEILRLMGESSRRLDIEFDPGDETQAVQQTILEKLDYAIKQAAAQQRKSRNRSRPQGEKRRRPKEGEKSKSKASSSDQEAEAADPQEAPAGKGSPVEGHLPPEELSESRRGWGHLPAREREEIIQGLDEAFLERYRRMIEQYYRALQEAESD